jgi:hypothetical protein
MWVCGSIGTEMYCGGHQPAARFRELRGCPVPPALRRSHAFKLFRGQCFPKIPRITRGPWPSPLLRPLFSFPAFMLYALEVPLSRALSLHVSECEASRSQPILEAARQDRSQHALQFAAPVMALMPVGQVAA